MDGNDKIAAESLHRGLESERVERQSVAIDVGFVALAPTWGILVVRQRAPGRVDGDGRRTAFYKPFRRPRRTLDEAYRRLEFRRWRDPHAAHPEPCGVFVV